MAKPQRRSLRAYGFRDKQPRKGIHGSDKRLRGGHHGRCILCGIQDTLCLSHIIPKWAYKWHKAAHGGTVRGMYLSHDLATIEQDGDKHYLMCGACESLASRSEAYVYALSNGTTDERRSVGVVASDDDSYSGFDFSLVVHFIATTALRAHYAPSLLFRDIRLPRASRAALRKMIFREAADSTIPWFMGVPFCAPPTQPDHDPREDIWIQYAENEFAGEAFIVFVGGWEWFAVFRTETELAEIAYEGRLKDSDSAVFVPQPYDIHRNIEHLYEDGKLKS